VTEFLEGSMELERIEWLRHLREWVRKTAEENEANG